MNSDTGFAKTDTGNCRFSMRILGKSKLNPHGDTILQMRRDEKTIAEILLYLRQEGVSTGQSTVSDWLQSHSEQLVSAQSEGKRVQKNPAQCSFGLLNCLSDAEKFSQTAGILRILWLPDHDWDEQKIARSIGAEGFGIPLNRDGEPDFTAFARKLGRRRVRTYGDMDFFLLALWSRKIRELCRTPVSNFADARRRSKLVLEIAQGIREEMLAAS